VEFPEDARLEKLVLSTNAKQLRAVTLFLLESG
jgi:hypothetical protein